MPLGYDFYPEINLVFVRAQGVITQRERIRMMLACLRDPQYERCSEALFDTAGVRSPPRIGDLRKLIAMLKQQLPARGPRRFAVVTSTPISFAVWLVFEHLTRLQSLP